MPPKKASRRGRPKAALKEAQSESKSADIKVAKGKAKVVKTKESDVLLNEKVDVNLNGENSNALSSNEVKEIENNSESLKVLKVSLKRSEAIDKLLLEKTEKIAEVDENGKDGESASKSKRGRKRAIEESAGDAKPAKILKEVKSKGQSKGNKMPDVTLLDFSNTSKSPSGKPWNLKLSSWNVNGIRAWLEKDGLNYLNHEAPDVLCVQETKCSEDKLPEEINVSGYHTYWLAGEKDGYSGVGLLSKTKPISVKYGIGVKEHDNEGRVITAEFEKFFLITTYVPNAGKQLVRLDYRMQWDKDFGSYLKTLDKTKPIVLCGDLNVAHEEIDIANPKTNKKNAGFTKEEREGFSTLLSEGFIDTFRDLYPDQKAAYTFWTYMMNARAKNVGWRLDYFVISKRFSDHLCDSVIRKDVMGSDHCPITLFLSV